MAVTEPAIVREFRVPATHACFAAHFPGRPLVPGALLMQWLCQAALWQFPDYRVVAVPSMKFLRPLLPGDVCTLKLRYELPLDQVRVELVRAGETICQGVLGLRQGGATSR